MKYLPSRASVPSGRSDCSATGSSLISIPALPDVWDTVNLTGCGAVTGAGLICPRSPRKVPTVCRYPDTIVSEPLIEVARPSSRTTVTTASGGFHEVSAGPVRNCRARPRAALSASPVFSGPEMA